MKMVVQRWDNFDSILKNFETFWKFEKNILNYFGSKRDRSWSIFSKELKMYLICGNVESFQTFSDFLAFVVKWCVSGWGLR